MKNIRNAACIIILSFSVCNLYSQKECQGLPSDLNKETIIFLEYELLPIDETLSGPVKNMYKVRNNNAPVANGQLNEQAKEYPFRYVISKRSVYKDSLASTCRYVLENEYMEAYNNGVNLNYEMNSASVSPMYIKDLKTGDKYELFNINAGEAYYYTGIMKKFVKAVKKEYNQ
jgi:hypothetical protein